MIAVTLTNPRHLRKANASAADYIEIRTDLYPLANIPSLIERSTKPVILTIKSRQSIWLDYCDHPNVRFVDLDYRLTQLVKDFHALEQSNTKLIISFHDYKETPNWKTLESRLKVIHKLKPDVIKIATMINTFDDLHVIMQLQKRYKKNIIAIGMGELGIITRIYNKALLTFARIDQAAAAAPGQLTIEQLQTGKVYGLVGDAIQYSLSPLMYTTAFAYHKLPYWYQLWDTASWKHFSEVFTFFELPAASVTQPFKGKALVLADSVETHAKKIGAVNCLLRTKSGKVVGYNTDWLGVQHALDKELHNKKVLILGSGGAAAAIQYAARKSNAAAVVVLSRKDMPTDEDDFDVLINATPVYDMVLVPEDALYSKVVMDCNYGTETELLRHAYKRARKVLDGLPMLIHQGAPQYKLWTGKSLPISEVEKAIARYRRKQKPLIF